MKVRTIGTNRASTMARGPCLSKNSLVLSTYACLKNRESGRLNSAGPALRPIRYPTWLPATAAMQTSTTTSSIGCLILLSATSRPTVNSSESPGRKKPMSRPHSAKMTIRVPISPRVSTSWLGSSQDGPSAVTGTATRLPGGARVLTPLDREHLGLTRRPRFARLAVDHEPHGLRASVDHRQHLLVVGGLRPGLEQLGDQCASARHPHRDVRRVAHREGQRRRPGGSGG